MTPPDRAATTMPECLADGENIVVPLRGAPFGAEPERPETPKRRHRFDCAACGQGIAVDEDGCCRMCGHDAQVIGAEPERRPQEGQ